VPGVDLTWSVQQLRAHMLAVLRPRDAVLAQLTLALVARGGNVPDAAAERAATLLDDPKLSLAAAGVVDGCWLLARVCSAAVPDEAPAQVRNVTLLTELLDTPSEEPAYGFRLSETRLQKLLSLHNALGLVAEPPAGASHVLVLDSLDQLCDGGTYYFLPKTSNALSDEVHARASHPARTFGCVCGEHQRMR
jgi:hypothetical protein